MPIKPNQHSPVTLVRVQQSDLDDLVAIRIDAMRESLERVGRFDPVQGRERFVRGFEAHNTHYIAVKRGRTYLKIDPSPYPLRLRTYAT
jgi:hypothetical protein